MQRPGEDAGVDEWKKYHVQTRLADLKATFEDNGQVFQHGWGAKVYVKSGRPDRVSDTFYVPPGGKPLRGMKRVKEAFGMLGRKGSSGTNTTADLAAKEKPEPWTEPDEPPTMSTSDGGEGSEEGDIDGEEFGRAEAGTPVVHLPEVPVVTGEEGEETRFDEHALLYRMGDDKMWHLRGKGWAFIKLREPTSYRFLFRDDETMVLRANHRITSGISVIISEMGPNVVQWRCPDFADGKKVEETFALRFDCPDLSQQFKRIYEAAIDATKSKMAAYINMDLCTIEKDKGNTAFRGQRYTEAVQHYTEALKRGPSSVNPEAHKLFCNRAACYTKLGAMNEGLADAEECIRLAPNFIKGYLRKGRLQLCMMDFASAIGTYKEGLGRDPDNQELREALVHCKAAITKDGGHSSEGSEEQGHSHGDTFEDDGVDGIAAGMANLGQGGFSHSPGTETRAPRKRVLIVGCSYRGTTGALGGTLHDAKDIKRLLVEHFMVPNRKENIMLLTDDHNDKMLLPTRRNIMKGMEWLMTDLQPGDTLFFYFAGHGKTQIDPTGRERRGNQVICPCDYRLSGAITDTEIHDRLVRRLPLSNTLHALIDSCHSGTAMNLPYNAVMEHGYFKDWEEEYPEQGWKKYIPGGLAVQFSAARHDQLAHESSRYHSTNTRGAATFAFTKAIQHHKSMWGFNILYSDLLEAMHDELRGSNYEDQDPQMSASVRFDPNDPGFKLKI